MEVKRESEVAQSCLTLSDPMDCSPPGSSIHGIFQARVLEGGAIAFSDVMYDLPQFEKIKAINKKKEKKIHIEALSSKETQSASGESDMTSGSVPRGPGPLWAQNLLRTQGDRGGCLSAAGL